MTDEELLAAIDHSVQAPINSVQTNLKAVSESLGQLITSVKESLEREMRSGLEIMEGRFDSQAARLERQGGLLQTGSRWTGRMNEWAERVDDLLEAKEHDIAELRRRIE